MRDNENTVLLGEKVILVPYRPEHVSVSPSRNIWHIKMTLGC